MSKTSFYKEVCQTMQSFQAPGIFNNNGKSWVESTSVHTFTLYEVKDINETFYSNSYLHA